MEGAMSSPIEVFISYSHKDELLRDELSRHLALLRRQGVITEWHDRRIGAGENWKAAIDDHLDHAELILLLISADFLASDYCFGLEMKRALDRHASGQARVIPVILRACDWTSGPIATLQALPTDGKPVTSWRNLDEAWTDVTRTPGSGTHIRQRSCSRSSATSASRHRISAAGQRG